MFKGMNSNLQRDAISSYDFPFSNRIFVKTLLFITLIKKTVSFVGCCDNLHQMIWTNGVQRNKNIICLWICTSRIWSSQQNSVKLINSASPNRSSFVIVAFLLVISSQIISKKPREFKLMCATPPLLCVIIVVT